MKCEDFAKGVDKLFTERRNSQYSSPPKAVYLYLPVYSAVHS
jgi:hypothetical protein